MAPEVRMGKPYNNKADIWSLGKTIVQLATGDPTNDFNETDFSKELKDFVNCCLQIEVEKRYSIDQLKRV